jgi:glycerol-3-phosphate dehydrogenase (NAD(P)+)
MNMAAKTHPNIVVAGGGAFGTALAIVISAGSASQNANVTLLMRNKHNAEHTQSTRCNHARLPNITLPDALNITADLSCISNADILLSVVPTSAQKDFAELARAHLSPNAVYVICSKGFDRLSGGLMSAQVQAILPSHDIAVLSGPGFASDIAKGLPTAMTIAGQTLVQAEDLSSCLSQKTFRLYGSDDVQGVQTGGALKNVLAIAAGIVTGAGLGESARASIIARGLAELSRYIHFMGGKAETASGLSGLGDLVLTATSEQSRNYRYGIELGRGVPVEQLTGPDKPLVEGANAAIAAADVGARQNINLPITKSVADIIKARIDVAQAIEQLLARPLRNEHE